MGSDERTLAELRPRHIWENDRQASECRRCNRRFNFLVRRHHCRRCGQIVCDRCSSHRIRLPVEELVEDPMISTAHYPIIAMNPQRICDSCIRIPIKASVEPGRRSGYVPPPYQDMGMRRSDSQQSLLTECPVCGTGLLGMQKLQQEQHLNQCLNTGSPTVRPPRYIGKRMPPGFIEADLVVLQ
ncbi:FYVE/PHD zinc finger protein [Hesseltinella vesiculosa]|uniref:FYVE/PHD zinc finger protein n=1 Tax=Hesseltinella vesiculosa TaxID=101127 RepID=A0A1X2GAA5_9FUNG|nr:FYVE/PHD zinc finger protein [Hesseltinella vesiculosa]